MARQHPPHEWSDESLAHYGRAHDTHQDYDTLVPCEYGHPKCSGTDRGYCIDEVLGVIEQRKCVEVSPAGSGDSSTCIACSRGVAARRLSFGRGQSWTVVLCRLCAATLKGRL